VLWTPWSDEKVPPPVVNDIGIKFWKDPDLQRYADGKGVKVVCLFAEFPDGHKTRLLAQGGQPIQESQRLEDLACYIDMMAVDAEFKESGDGSVVQVPAQEHQSGDDVRP
jgi:hypothetical protein